MCTTVDPVLAVNGIQLSIIIDMKFARQELHEARAFPDFHRPPIIQRLGLFDRLLVSRRLKGSQTFRGQSEDPGDLLTLLLLDGALDVLRQGESQS